MIIKGIFNLIYNLLNYVLLPIDLPDFPDTFTNALNDFIGYMEGAVGIVSLFIRPITFRTLLPLCIVMANFEKIYSFIMWVLRKLPFLGIE